MLICFRLESLFPICGDPTTRHEEELGVVLSPKGNDRSKQSVSSPGGSPFRGETHFQMLKKSASLIGNEDGRSTTRKPGYLSEAGNSYLTLGCKASFLQCTRRNSLLEPTFICRWAIDRRDRNVEQAQINAELCAVMNEVAQNEPPYHRRAWQSEECLAGHLQ